jgi:hypothetical protein
MSALGPVLMLAIVVFSPMLLFLWNYKRCANKVAAYFLEESTSLKPELCKTYGDDWILSKDGAYRLNTDKTRNVRFPSGWPSMLQQVVPALLYQRGNLDPLDWRTLNLEKHLSAREVGALLDPEWLRALVKGIREGAGGGLTKIERIVLFVAAGSSVFALIMVFVLMTKK